MVLLVFGNFVGKILKRFSPVPSGWKGSEENMGVGAQGHIVGDVYCEELSESLIFGTGGTAITIPVDVTTGLL